MANSSSLLDVLQIDRVLSYFAAGTTKRTSAIIDMANYDGVIFIVDFSTLIDAGTLDVFVEEHTLNQTSGMTRILGQTVHTITTAQAALTASCIVVDVYRPVERYLQVNATPAAQNAVITGATAIRYAGRTKPPTRPTNVLKTTILASPGE